MSYQISQESKKVIYKIHELLVKNNDYNGAIELALKYLNEQDSDNIAIKHWLGLCYLEAQDYSNARDTYISFNAYYQAGYCEMLMGNIKEAGNLWEKEKLSEVKYWSKCLETLVLGKVVHIPTFLNLRNHLETDLGYLLRAKQEEYANKILLLADDLIQINLESYKFIGRALLNNGYEHISINYLLKAQKLLPNDPEIYYHLGQYSMNVKAIGEAKSMFKHCLMLSPAYTPASDRLREFKQKS